MTIELSIVSPSIASRTPRVWRVLQSTVWLIGLGIIIALVFAPEIGLHALWDVLIPVAPALFMVAPGLWRNVCPLGTTALFGRHMGWTKSRRLSVEWQDRFGLIGVGLLFAIVPLRHVVLDTSGYATALALGVLATLAIVVSSQFRWKSAWCSGMCPVHQVERLYGTEPIATFHNAHCHECERCVARCPDSTPGVSETSSEPARARWLAGAIMSGAFPGFVWGWFHVPDYTGLAGWSNLGSIYGIPLAAAVVTSLVYAMLMGLIGAREGRLIRQAFAAAAISWYYWYRLPALFGFSALQDGMLVDLTGVLPAWFPMGARMATTGFFFLWLVERRGTKRAWLKRPQLQAGIAAT